MEYEIKYFSITKPLTKNFWRQLNCGKRRLPSFFRTFRDNVLCRRFKTAVNYGSWWLEDCVRAKFIRYFSEVFDWNNRMNYRCLVREILWELCGIFCRDIDTIDDDVIRIIILYNIHIAFRHIRRIVPQKLGLADVFINCDKVTLKFLDEKKYFAQKNLRDGIMYDYLLLTEDKIYDYVYSQDKYYFWEKYLRPIFMNKEDVEDNELMRFIYRFVSKRSCKDPKIYQAAVDSGRKCLVKYFGQHYLESLGKKAKAMLYRIEIIEKNIREID